MIASPAPCDTTEGSQPVGCGGDRFQYAPATGLHVAEWIVNVAPVPGALRVQTLRGLRGH